MAQDYNEYLAIEVLNEQHFISYRNLSRALKVHSNLAKQMLYDFHRKQNSKKPGSVHATYVLSGTKSAGLTSPVQSQGQQTGDDSVMQSSPPLPSSSMQPNEDDATTAPRIHSIMLVKEEHLEEARKQFESISGIHIYSLEASSIGDIQVLTDCNRRVATEYAGEDPLKEWRQYGVIQNKDVRRRTRSGVPPKIVPTAKSGPAKAAPKATTAAAPAKAATPTADVKPAEKNAPPSKFDTSKKPAKKNDSSIFKSFAKGTANAKKKAEAEAEDVAMGGFSDDDDEDAGSGLPEELAEVKEPTGESKNDRKARLEAMMDAEDEEMEDATATPAVATPADTTDSQHDEGAIDGAAVEAKEEPKETVTVENGRRRGRRRVMKKKTVKDEDGYLVTREEPVWEEFSEEEPAPKKAKISAPASNKPVKKGGKPGQGSIMSFFGKK